MKVILHFARFFALLALFLSHGSSFSQEAVEVTARFDTNQIPLGGSTTLRIYAQVIPSLRPSSDRIFSWYVDLINLNPSLASADYPGLLKLASDNDPSSSSFGTDDEASRRGIYDSFLELPGAGVAQPVELVAVQVSGTASGIARFQVAAGSGVPGLVEDFIVAPAGGGDFFSGGIYSIAFDDLEILPQCDIRLAIRPPASGNLELTFNTCTGFNHTVEIKSQLGAPGPWQPLPNAPHNSGEVTIPAPAANQYFRVVRTIAP